MDGVHTSAPNPCGCRFSLADSENDCRWPEPDGHGGDDDTECVADVAAVSVSDAAGDVTKESALGGFGGGTLGGSGMTLLGGKFCTAGWLFRMGNGGARTVACKFCTTG